MRKFIYTALVAAAAFVLIQSCKKSGDDGSSGDSSFDRKAMLTNISTNMIIPAYTAFQADAANLDAAITAFVASPDADKLTAAQAAFKTTYQQWQATSIFEVGPAEQIQLRVNTNTYPANVSQINANITNNTYNPSLIANYPAKGLPAMDYLLFGTGANNADILTQYTSDSKAANRKTYLAAMSAELKTNAATVLAGWSTYKTTFINADGTDTGSSTGQLVNQLVYDYEILKNFEIGIPAGVQSQGTTHPEFVQAYYSQISLQLAKLHLQAVQNVYTGKDGLGFDDYLTKIDAGYKDGGQLNTVISTQFATAATKLNSLTDPLAQNITSNTAAVTAAYTELQKLTVMLKTDMTSSLGILITFGDNDGD